MIGKERRRVAVDPGAGSAGGAAAFPAESDAIDQHNRFVGGPRFQDAMGSRMVRALESGFTSMTADRQVAPGSS